MRVSPNSRIVDIHIQGRQVLKFINIKENEVLFDVIGFNKPIVRIIDQRSEIVNKMKEIEKTGKVHQLTDLFCTPARLHFLPSRKKTKEIVIRLTNTRSKTPGHMLWIATNIKREIPYFDFKKLEVQPYGRKYVLFSLYKRPVIGKVKTRSRKTS